MAWAEYAKEKLFNSVSFGLCGWRIIYRYDFEQNELAWR
jgi:hypothetical protein